MRITDIIELAGIFITFILGIASLIVGVKSIKNSKSANGLAATANKLSEEALKISKNIENEQKECIEIQSYKNLEIVKSDDVELKGNQCAEEYLLIVPVELKNISSLPVSVNRPSFCWGDDGEYLFVLDDELYSIKGINEDITFPIYLKGKQTIHFKIAIGFSSSDRMQFYSNKGITICFDGVKKTHKKYISSSYAIDNNREDNL